MYRLTGQPVRHLRKLGLSKNQLHMEELKLLKGDNSPIGTMSYVRGGNGSRSSNIKRITVKRNSCRDDVGIVCRDVATGTNSIYPVPISRNNGGESFLACPNGFNNSPYKRVILRTTYNSLIQDILTRYKLGGPLIVRFRK